MIQAQEELQSLTGGNRSVFYTPTGACQDFLQSIDKFHPGCFIHMASFANRQGKSAMGANIIVNLTLGIQNKWFDLPFFRDFRRPNRGRIIGNRETLDESVLIELPKWLPAGSFHRRKAGKEFYSEWEIPSTGCSFDVLTTDQELEKFEAATLHWLIIDEPCTEEQFTASVSRLEPGGIIIITATPLRGAAWIFDRIGWDFNFDLDDLRRNWGFQEGQWNIMYADDESNCQEHGVRGRYPHWWLVKKREEYTEDEREARVKGIPMGLAGLIFNVNPLVHFVTGVHIPDNYPKVWHIDAHGSVPDHCIGIAISPQDDLYVYDEFVPAKGRSVREVAGELRHDIWRTDHIDLVLNDPLADWPNPLGGKNIKQEYELYLGMGLQTAPTGRDELDNCIRFVQDKLTGVAGRPTLYFLKDRVPVTIHELRRWRRDEKTGKPEDKNDHMMSGLYRICQRKYRFRDFVRISPYPQEDEPEGSPLMISEAS